MRQDSRLYLKKLNDTDLSQELKCVNALQRTAFAINHPVLEVIRHFWDQGNALAGLPNRDNLTPPPYPFDKNPDQLSEYEYEQFKKWKMKRKVVFDDNNRNLSKRIAVERTIQLAEDYAQYPAFYFVWQCDFRGRKYPVGEFMTPQSADWAKALMTFADGVDVNTADDAQWLAIHGANCFGVDKVSLTDRELWAYAHSDLAIEVAQNPYDNRWWIEADEPWQFLAWCFEWAGWRTQGPGFVTHLPCAADGSVNGLQHLSAILRDSRGGKAVNLTPSEKPEDLYSDVARLATQQIEAEAAEGNDLAQAVLKMGITRKHTKRSCMIVPYSGTLYACKDYIAEAIKETLNGEAPPWGEDRHNEAVNYIASHVWTSIQGVVSSAKEVMDFLKDVGRVCAKENKAMEWITPSGFLVRQAYPEMDKCRIKTNIDGSVISLSWQKALQDSINLNRSVNGASPNFIHSLDASALTLTVNKCVDVGIEDFAMVHDSYGTHSPNMPALSTLLREAFVDMYEDNDVLEQLRSYVSSYVDGDLPEVPQKGDLDITEVLHSPYFFA